MPHRARSLVFALIVPGVTMLIGCVATDANDAGTMSAEAEGGDDADVIARAAASDASDANGDVLLDATLDALDDADAEAGVVDVVDQKTMLTSIISDRAGAAALTDLNLVDAWGLAFDTSGTLWVANNGTGTATAYDLTTIASAAPPVHIGTVDAGVAGTPTGEAFNGDPTAFGGDSLVFCTEDGGVFGWSGVSGAAPILRVDRSATGDQYEGLAISGAGTGALLLLADFAHGKIVVLDTNYQVKALAGTFSDPALPADYAAYNVLAVGANVYVSFAERSSLTGQEIAGVGLGAIAVFDTAGRLVRTLAVGGVLNEPWGLAIAPSGFGTLGGALLVGNFGDGFINAYDVATGARVGHLIDVYGQPIAIDGLWAISFGSGVGGAGANQLFFSSGPFSEQHGLVGRLDAQ
jgi:uncharacterized protein (TIGR03118 family)